MTRFYDPGNTPLPVEADLRAFRDRRDHRAEQVAGDPGDAPDGPAVARVDVAQPAGREPRGVDPAGNGLVVDIRRAPVELQRLAYEKGLIRFVPAERATTIVAALLPGEPGASIANRRVENWLTAVSPF